MSTKKSDLTLKNVAESSSANEIKAIAENAENEKVKAFEASANDVPIKPKKTAKTYNIDGLEFSKGQINRETAYVINKRINSVSKIIEIINDLRKTNSIIKQFLLNNDISNFCTDTNSYLVRDIKPTDFLKDPGTGLFSTLTSVYNNEYNSAFNTDKKEYFFKPFSYTVASALASIRGKKRLEDFKANKVKKEESKKAKETKEENAKASQKAKLFDAIKGLTKEEKMELLKTA